MCSIVAAAATGADANDWPSAPSLKIGRAHRCPQLCATGGTVVWTRHRRAPDLVPDICRWFAARGFDLEALSDRDAGFGVAAHRFTGPPQPLEPGATMFRFARSAVR